MIPAMAARGRCPLWGARVRAAVQRALSEPAPRTVALGAGLQYHLPPPLLLLGAFSCVGDLRTNEGQARHVGLTAGEGVALSNVVQSRPASGTAGLRGPDLLPIPEATGLAPPCSLGRSENL